MTMNKQQMMESSSEEEVAPIVETVVETTEDAT